jgi:hypothetical protein
VLRSETVNGIATKVYEAPVPEIKGKMRMFIAEAGDFIVKQVMIPGGGPEQTLMEVSRLAFDKPAANLFVAPQNCQVVAGETNATGGHVEMDASATAAGEKALNPAKPRPKPAPKPAPKPVPNRAAAPAPKAAAPAGVPEIEVLGAGVGPLTYTGPAPAAYTFSFSISASGPVEAVWVLVSQADTAWESGTLKFDAAGTKELKVPVKIGVGNGVHWEGAGHLEVVVGETRVSSPTLKITADCKAK